MQHRQHILCSQCDLNLLLTEAQRSSLTFLFHLNNRSVNEQSVLTSKCRAAKWMATTDLSSEVTYHSQDLMRIFVTVKLRLILGCCTAFGCVLFFLFVVCLFVLISEFSADELNNCLEFPGCIFKCKSLLNSLPPVVSYFH